MKRDDFDNQSKAIFAQLPEAKPSPYFAARVAARAKTSPNRELTLWRWVAALSITVVIALGSYIQFKPQQDLLYTYEPYVIQVDFNAAELKLAESAEIELPDGVSFVSKNDAIKALRSMRLKVNGRKDGKLPFVLVSEREGSLALRVRMYNAEDELVQTKTLTLNFGKKG